MVKLHSEMWRKQASKLEEAAGARVEKRIQEEREKQAGEVLDTLVAVAVETKAANVGRLQALMQKDPSGLSRKERKFLERAQKRGFTCKLERDA